MGGLAAFRTMREREPDLPGIVASGYSDDPVMADPTAFGFAAALTKPFEQKDVMGTIARVLNARGS